MINFNSRTKELYWVSMAVVYFSGAYTAIYVNAHVDEFKQNFTRRAFENHEKRGVVCFRVCNFWTIRRSVGRFLNAVPPCPRVDNHSPFRAAASFKDDRPDDEIIIMSDDNIVSPPNQPINPFFFFLISFILKNIRKLV